MPQNLTSSIQCLDKYPDSQSMTHHSYCSSALYREQPTRLLVAGMVLFTTFWHEVKMTVVQGKSCDASLSLHDTCELQTSCQFLSCLQEPLSYLRYLWRSMWNKEMHGLRLVPRLSWSKEGQKRTEDLHVSSCW